MKHRTGVRVLWFREVKVRKRLRFWTNITKMNVSFVLFSLYLL